MFAVAIAGALINAGPSDAFSVRVFVRRELDWAAGVDLLEKTAKLAADNEKATGDWRAIRRAFIDRYQREESSVPVIRVGERLDFVVIARLERGDAYLEELLSARTGGEHRLSCHWTTVENEQAHGVHARSRTILGREVLFGPDDLCSPFETRRRGFALPEAFGSLRLGSR